MTENDLKATNNGIVITSRALMRQELGNDSKIPGKAPWISYRSGLGAALALFMGRP
jgi:hypothetical protein